MSRRVAGLLAQFPSQPDEAVAAAVYLHGRVDDLGARAPHVAEIQERIRQLGREVLFFNCTAQESLERYADLRLGRFSGGSGSANLNPGGRGLFSRYSSRRRLS